MAIRVTWSPSDEPERHADEPQGQRTWDARACLETTVKTPVCPGEHTALHKKDEEDRSPGLSGKFTVDGRGFPHKMGLRYVFVFEYCRTATERIRPP